MKSNGHKLNLPAGFRFHPTDEELVEHYLCCKCAGQQISAPIIAEIDLYKFDPWQLPDMAVYGEEEWYFFSPRDRKYPNGSRPNRTAGTGYWKATGADKPLGQPKTLGIKKSLVFYAGKAPRGIKTNWIMHEYRLANVDRSAGKKTNSRLDEWVLCRIYNKKGTTEKHFNVGEINSMEFSDGEDHKPNIVEAFQYNGMMPQSVTPTGLLNYTHFVTSETMSSLGHVLSPEFKIGDYREVQSEEKWTSDFEEALDFQLNYADGFHEGPVGDQMSLFQDMFGYVHTPF